jgi:hypothetical protein
MRYILSADDMTQKFSGQMSPQTIGMYFKKSLSCQGVMKNGRGFPGQQGQLLPRQLPSTYPLFRESKSLPRWHCACVDRACVIDPNQFPAAAFARLRENSNAPFPLRVDEPDHHELAATKSKSFGSRIVFEGKLRNNHRPTQRQSRKAPRLAEF